ncbi:MAG: Imm39 family immunity protein [Paraglaciecola polaris]|uniref:Imm39 family immunity protein n=1 Tax=Paraglaciecola polaris TaxID=222814 RepID=UPI003001F7B6|tara:strand:- start:128 stop:499 length:372 start_codon:yes stop_codon:yes gene_type:complete
MSKYPVLIGGVGLIKGRIKNIGQAMVSVCDEVKPVIEQSNAFEGMPFNEINMVIRWAEESINEPEIGPLRKTKQSLEVATTISLREGKAVENNPEQLKSLVKAELAKVLKAIEVKYGLCQVHI